MMFAINIRYLLCISVATDIGRREPPERAEWPPHPARIFMAMAAAYFENDRTDEERSALEWLEGQDAPVMYVPRGHERTPVTRYVPVNDKETLPKDRSRQARTFPAMVLENEVLMLMWPDTDLPDEIRVGLTAICSKVTRIGHSSSVVQLWIDEDHRSIESFVSDEGGRHEIWEEANGVAVGYPNLRVAREGTLERLRQSFNEQSVAEYGELKSKIANSKGKEKKAFKKELENRFGKTRPTTRRPIIRTTARYAIRGSEQTVPVQTVFDDQMLILAKHESHDLGLESTLQLAKALRGAIHSQFSNNEIPNWISGHADDGGPIDKPHLAIVPLAFVSSQHADGHLLGMAIVFPRDVHPRDHGRGLSKLLLDENGKPKTIELKLGRAGVWYLRRELSPSPPHALRMATWTGLPDEWVDDVSLSETWASVTPVVLDRYPKTDREKDRVGWREEVTEIISKSCRNIGLPKPVAIDIDKTSWHLGAPRARPAGGGFPLMPHRPGSPSRYQVHVWLRFDRPVIGPVLIGAGRYLGYGLCKPIRQPRKP